MRDGQNVGNERSRVSGIWYAIAAYIMWGALPLYWRFLDEISALELLAQRIVWSLVFVFCLLALKPRWSKLKLVLKNRKSLIAMISCSLIITLNWFVYIWAITNEHVVDTSLGYYISPLFSILLGGVVLRERFNVSQMVSIVLAFTGVIILAVSYGKVPWIALILASTFGTYGLIKKVANIDAVMGLFIETAIVAPVALIYLLTIQFQGVGSFGVVSVSTTILLMLSGVATALPLLWFAMGAQRIPLSMVGFLQFITPTLLLIVGVVIFKEAFSSAHMLSFTSIWSACLIYSISGSKLFKQKKTKVKAMKE